MNTLFSTSANTQNYAIAFVRIIIAALLMYHGWEVFNNTKMNEYAAWDMYKNLSYGKSLVIFGKTAELIAGVLLLLGLFTRIACIIIIGTFVYITFFIGHGKFWYEDQHPFLFVLFGLLFFFIGAGNISIDKIIQKKN